MKSGLVAARTSIALLIGFAVAFTIIVTLDGWHGANVPRSTEPAIPAPSPRPLTPEEREWANIAWRYFQSNTQSTTGLADSVEGRHAASMWDTASYLLATISADRLALISREETDARMSQALTTLATIPLFDETLPNKSYDTITLGMVDDDNQPTVRGVGWSAIDIGRLMVPFTIIAWHYPAHTSEVRAVLDRWQIGRAARDSVLSGASVVHDTATYVQEGRLGYEEYGARGLTLVGLDVQEALRADDFLTWVDTYGVSIGTDSRKPAARDAHNSIVSEPYILDGLELGGDHMSRELAWRVARAQERRFEETGILTAVSASNIDRAPYFVYNAVFANGRPWNAIAPDGRDASSARTLSTTAAFGWNALYDTPYTRKLIVRVASAHDRSRGWYAGIYEENGQANTAVTADTNAIVLESLAYRQAGRLLKVF